MLMSVNHWVIRKIDALFALRSYDETKIHQSLKPNSAVIDSDRSELRVCANKQELDRGCEPPKKINWQSLSFGLSDNEQSWCKHYIICKTRSFLLDAGYNVSTLVYVQNLTRSTAIRCPLVCLTGFRVKKCILQWWQHCSFLMKM